MILKNKSKIFALMIFSLSTLSLGFLGTSSGSAFATANAQEEAQEKPAESDDDDDADDKKAPAAKADGDEPADGEKADGATATGKADAAGEDGEAKEGDDAKEATASDGTLLQYIRGLDYNPQMLLAKKPDGSVKVDVGAEDVVTGEPQETKETDKSGKITTCTRTTHSLTGASDSVAIVQPTQGVIYPGALILVDSNMVDGKPSTVPDLKRGTVRLHVKLPGIGQDGIIAVEDPSESKVQAAIDAALHTWMEKNTSEDSYKNASRSNFQVTESFTSDQMAVKMGASVGYMAVSASAGFGMSSSKDKRVISAVYKQIFYTITFDPPNGFTPDQFFDPSVTAEQAKSAFNDEKPLGYVASVDYGRLLMFNMETDRSTSSMEAEAALKASLGAVNIGVEASTKNAKILENSKISIVALGGSAEKSSTVNAAKGAADLQEIIQGKNALFSKDNPGVAIGYTVKFAKDNTTALLGKTTDYVAEECNSVESRWIRVENTGAFAVRDFVLSYDVGKKDCKANPASCDRNSGSYAPDVVLRTGNGNLVRWDIPGDATNVKLFGNVVAGTDRVKWLDDPKTDFNVCYQTQGTTLSSSEFVKLIKGQGGCN